MGDRKNPRDGISWLTARAHARASGPPSSYAAYIGGECRNTRRLRNGQEKKKRDAKQTKRRGDNESVCPREQKKEKREEEMGTP